VICNEVFLKGSVIKILSVSIASTWLTANGANNGNSADRANGVSLGGGPEGEPEGEPEGRCNGNAMRPQPNICQP